ncbi:MAG: hypothetical protein WA110_04025 [Anaerolineaceae bacterium]
MAKILTPTARITQARRLIQTARDIPVPDSAGWEYFSYVAQVKEQLRKAFELIKLISYSPSTPEDVKAEAKAVLEEISAAEMEILKSSRSA